MVQCQAAGLKWFLAEFSSLDPAGVRASLWLFIVLISSLSAPVQGEAAILGNCVCSADNLFFHVGCPMV